MILIRISMTVRPEKRKELCQTLSSMLDSEDEGSGIRNFGVFSDIETGMAVILLSEWETREALEHYFRSDRFSVLLGTRSLLYEPLSIQIMMVSKTEGMDVVNGIRKTHSQGA